MGIIWNPDEYDEWYKKEPGKTIDAIETNCVMSLLFPIFGDKVLDVGCGTGNFALKLKNLGFDVVCVDPEIDMLSKASKKGLYTKIGKAENLPFDNESFDAVVSVAAISFFEEKERAVREMLRVVKKNGKVVIGFITGPWAEFYMKKGEDSNNVFSNASFIETSFFTKFDEFFMVKHCLRTSPKSENVNFAAEASISLPGFGVALLIKE